MNNLNHTCYTLSRNSNRCDVCGARLPRLIDADALRKEFEREGELNPCDRLFWGKVLSVIDNAPTEERIVCRSRDWSNECTHSSSFEQGYVQGYEEGKNDRPKGKWITVNLQQENDGGAFMCSCCKERSWDYGNSYHFCPNCGACMER